MRKLTSGQTETWEFIKSETTKNGYAPSIRAMAAHFGVSTSTVLGRFRALEARGMVKRVAFGSTHYWVRGLPQGIEHVCPKCGCNLKA